MGIDAVMYVLSKAKHTEAEINGVAWQMCAVFGANNFFVERNKDRPHHALELGNSQDGETIIHVRLLTRYWGPGYERGSLALLLALGEWLERKFPHGEVWYGGDCDDECSLFDRAARAKLLDHAASEHGTDYFMSTPGPMCEFCQALMNQCRYGAGGIGSVCLGCRLHRLVDESGGLTEAVGRWPDDKFRP
jgi:hypothetical protein